MLCILSFEVSAPSTWTQRFLSWGNWFTTRTSCSYWTGARLRVRDVGCMHIVEVLCVSESVLVCAEPYMLIMEYVSYGTLKTYLQTNRSHLSANPELQSLLTIASYHIALAMQHLRSKMVTRNSCYQISTLTNHTSIKSFSGSLSTYTHTRPAQCLSVISPSDRALWFGSKEHHGQ